MASRDGHFSIQPVSERQRIRSERSLEPVSFLYGGAANPLFTDNPEESDDFDELPVDPRLGKALLPARQINKISSIL